MPNNEQYYQILKQYWGYDEFRPLQLDIIASVGRGESSLALMPTGGGKSITFQVPAMALDGICLVISPLVALMKDQVENLRKRGIKAAAIHSAMTHEQILTTLENCEYGDFKFLYVSPERLKTELFLERLNFLRISMIAVDEAHCISQWGYDFRPSYLQIADLLQRLPHDTPVLALTATATPMVVDDIQDKLRFSRKQVFRKSFERKNLNYVVRHTNAKFAQLINILNNVPGSSIVYVRSRRQTKEISDLLNDEGISADFFHAGLYDADKSRKQEAWKRGSTRVIVATNAFGMGIDKPDVRTVVHLELPDSLEAYFQEAGRAGRDEKNAYAVLLYSKTDGSNLKRRISDNFPSIEFISKVYQHLANYFTLAVGYGLDACYPFSLTEFCRVCKLPQNQTHSALKILELSGYIMLTEELDNPSVLQFIVSREELYRLQNQNKALDLLIETLLRSYTGLFAQPVHINEDTIAERLNTDRNTVYDNLIKLDKMGIVRYVPYKKSPLLIYTKSRVDNKDLTIPKAVYDSRRQRFVSQIEAVLEYAEDIDICLNLKLLNYFGQSTDKPCGICSVCRDKRSKELTQEQISAIEKQIVSTLSVSSHTADALVQTLRRFRRENIVAVLHKLIDEERIVQNSAMMFELRR